MLTGDENIVDINFSVFWVISDAAAFLFRIQFPERTIKAVAESAMREVVGNSEIQPILTGARQKTEEGVRGLMQETLDWWSTQPAEIADEALGDNDRISLDEMVKKINKWSVGVDVFWCQGPLFDYAILQNIYKQLGYPVPWQYWQIRDSRTLFSLVPRDPNEKRTGMHNALEDCYFQAKKVQKVYKDLNIRNV